MKKFLLAVLTGVLFGAVFILGLVILGATAAILGWEAIGFLLCIPAYFIIKRFGEY